MPSLTSTPRRRRRTAAHAGACAAVVADLDDVAVADAEPRRILRVDQRLRAAARFASEVAVSVKDELRKLCAGEVASLNGCALVDGLVDRPVVGQGRACRATAPRRPSLESGVWVQSGLNRNFPSGKPKPSRKWASSNGGWRSSQRSFSSVGEDRRSRSRCSVQSMISRGAHGEGADAQRPAAWRARRSLRDSSGTRPAGRSPSARTGDAGGRRRCRGRRARGTWSPAGRCRRSARCRS